MFFRKKKIITLAQQTGCDWDGDLFVYKGYVYFVDISQNYVKRMSKLKTEKEKCV